MGRKSTLLAYLFLFSLVAQAQITGRVTDSAGYSMRFSEVLLLKAADSAIITGTTADTSASFNLKTATTGDFRILVAYPGYKKLYSNVFTITQPGQSHNAGIMILHSDSHPLYGITITAQKPFMEQKIDRTVFNIESNVVFAGSNALEILAKLPGVSVDNNDNIKVAGRPGIMVMIDGKKSYMSATDLAQYLKGLDANQVEKIEVITNPSAKYDAAGSAIINIVLKKDKNLGFNGNVFTTYNQGIKWGNYNGFNANYRIKKWNFFGGGGFGIHYNLWYDNITNTFNPTSVNPQQVFTANNSNQLFGKNYNVRGGIDFTPTDKQTITIQANGGAGEDAGYKNTNTNMYGSGSELDSSLYRQGNVQGNWIWQDYALNYTYKIDTTGRELTASVDYSPFFNGDNGQNYTYYYTSAGQYLRPSTLLTYSLPVNGTVWAAQADYSNPIGTNNKLDFGLKGSIVSVDNNDQFWNVENGITDIDTTKSNHFIYKENIYAGYFNYYHKFSEKLEIQLGLRGEETQITGTQYVHDTSFTRNYFNLFPSAFVTWKLNDNNSFNFSYSRRIDRPDYGELNPFIQYIDPYTYYAGNINLLPQYVDNFEIKYTYKTWLNAGLRYSYYVNVEAPLYTQNDSTHITYRQLGNLGFFDEGDFSVTATIPITPWFTTITTSDLYYNNYIGTIQGGGYSNVGYIWQPNTINTFRLKKGWSADVTFRYSSRNLNGPSITEPFYVVEAGIKKQFGGGRGTVSLNCSDVFWSNRQKTIYDFNGVNNVEYNYWDSRRVRLTISWKLGKSQYQREEKKKAAAEELNRAKTGN